MAMNKSYYTCSPYTTPQLLRSSGEEPVEVTLNYVYELDVPTTSDEETTTTILDLATQHISSTLLKRIATSSNLVDCSDIHHSDPFRRRRLRFRGGRGSNSLIGIASNGSSVNTEKVCQFNVSGSEVKEVEQFIEGVTGDFSGSVVVMEAEEEEEQQQGRDDGGVDAIGGGGGGEVLAETRVDGVIDPASVIRSAAPLPTTTQLKESNEEEGGSAYNYLSTQSEIKEAKSIRTQPTVGENSGVSLRQSSVNTVMMTPPKLRSGGTAGTTCNVIQGQITLFISNIADPFENLDGRILEAIKDDLNDDMIIQQEFMNNEVVGLRLLEPAMVDKLPSSPSVSVTAPAVAAAAAAASSPSNTNDAAESSGFVSSNASIGVIGGLGAILLMLIGLFAYTSRPRTRGRYRLDDDDLNSCQYDDDKYENELDAVSAVLSGKDSSSSWWQEPVRMNDSIDSRSVMESSIPTVEACYSTEGVIIGNDHIDEAFAEDKSPKILPLSFFNRKSKSRDEETDATSNIVGGDLMKSESLLDEEQSQSTVDMDAHLFGSAEESKPRNAKSFGSRLFGRKRTTVTENDDALIDDDVVIEEIQSRAKTQDEEVLIQESYSQDAFGIETTRSAPLRPMSAYVSPSTVSSRSRGPNDYYAERALQSCASGALSSCIPDLPSPEIGDEQSYISALTDNYFDQYSRRGPPACTQTDGEKLMRLAKGAVSQCVAPTDDTSVPTIPTSVPTKQQQLARRQPNGNNLDAFADCWNPFEGNFWQGWFE
eukprot:CAMPEP_0113417040 /NCGR_PEP_ID=MMETSP0013_2-20120614/25441_1 /TAXON_ID=2843 ORGANISM="Skeletonema costatum, Strain 1716" /NCGR_SAMPLE_ID=MMETSP0013_2 /ASSEMBLY_ACC=CAM_ASM_000158 /LENGTH=763 /DNA_ID=CAMNT_0000304143 /DNA_START=44 /DNA_END=2335 /DNA_ORIENTATION=- /assembly_acc=CAM_ASM_000158